MLIRIINVSIHWGWEGKFWKQNLELSFKNLNVHFFLTQKLHFYVDSSCRNSNTCTLCLGWGAHFMQWNHQHELQNAKTHDTKWTEKRILVYSVRTRSVSWERGHWVTHICCHSVHMYEWLGKSLKYWCGGINGTYTYCILPCITHSRV